MNVFSQVISLLKGLSQIRWRILLDGKLKSGYIMPKVLALHVSIVWIYKVRSGFGCLRVGQHDISNERVMTMTVEFFDVNDSFGSDKEGLCPIVTTISRTVIHLRTSLGEHSQTVTLSVGWCNCRNRADADAKNNSVCIDLSKSLMTTSHCGPWLSCDD